MKKQFALQVFVKVFDDPEYCCDLPLRGEEKCLYLRHGHCMIFPSGDFNYFDPLGDFESVMVTKKGESYKKCKKCKELYSEQRKLTTE